MFDVSAGEMLAIGVVALIVIGPKELPGLLRTLGQSATKLRRMAGEFRTQFDDAMREADLHETQKTMRDTADLAKSAVSGFNPIETIRNEIKSTVDEIKGAGKEAEAAINAPVASGPPVSVLEPPPVEPVVIEAPVVEAPVVEEPEPAAKPKRARKKPAGDA